MSEQALERTEDSEATIAARGFESFAVLRTAHLELRQALVESADRRSPEAAKRIVAFLAKAQQTGTVLNDLRERGAAQNLLNYWCMELAASSAAGSRSIQPTLLAAFAPNRVEQSGDQAALSEESDSRKFIRLTAQARRWRDSGERDDDLLRDTEAIDQAFRLAKDDTILSDFAIASRAAVARRKQGRERLIFGSVGAVVITLLVVWFWQIKYLPYRAFEQSNELARPFLTSDRRAEILRWFNSNQSFLRPQDFTKQDWIGTSFDNMTLYAPNFVGGTFKNVSMIRTNMKGAVLVETKFLSDGRPNDLRLSILSSAQFRDSQFGPTIFWGADLSWATFDRTDLCGVDFLAANVRKASFYDARMDEKTKESLRNTAWWQANGLSWSYVSDFARQGKSSLASKIGLQNTQGYKTDVRDILRDFQRLRPADTFNRALLLNSLAWTRAIWGVEITDKEEGAEEASAACSANDVPKSARRAVDRAVCILKKLKEEESPLAGLVLPNVQDSQAYILLQSGDAKRALEVLREIAPEEQIAKDKSGFFKDPEQLFRYAIAQHAGGEGPNEKAAAIEKFKTAIDREYQPTHELGTLGAYIFNVPEFVASLETQKDRFWPGSRAEPVKPRCSATTPAER